MKKIINSMLMLAMAAMTFVSCEDVPEPYSWPTPPENEEAVITPSGSGTLEDPYNVAAILEIVQALPADEPLSKELYVKGIVTDIPDGDYGISSKYNNATFYISDNAEGSNSFEIYRCKGHGGNDITDANLLSVGDEVVIFCSEWVNYKGNTPETKQGAGYIYSINGKTAEKKPVAETIGTLDDPITVSKAVELINALADGGTTEQDAYIKGKITTIKTKDEDIAKYKNIDYIISDGTNELTVFRGKNLNNTDFTEAGQINVGDEVVVIGKLTKYVDKNGKMTPEVAQGNYIVKLTKGGGGGDTPSGKGSVSDPYSVPEALAAINALEDGGYSATEVYVKGKVVKVTTNQANFEKYGNLNYLISENGEDANTITVYSGDGLKGEKFSGIDALKQGDEVIVYGKLQKYVKNDNVTPEIAKGNYLYSLNGKTEPGGGGGGETTGTGTLENPLTATQAYDAVAAMEKGAVSEADYYVKGKISSIKYTFSAEYGTATFNISDDGTGNSKQFIAYSCYYFGNQPWAEGNKQVNVGDEVIVCGKVVNYNGNTPEFASKKNYLVSLNGSSSSKRR